jgi:ATP-dependent Lhr-like helicase
MRSAYSRLAPFIREYIYEKKWKQLRDIQEAAVNEIFDGSGHILIAAGTASGKTEACFFPIISLFSENPPSSIGVLYIGPLKALINDQASRLEPLLEQAEIPLWRWHGDVPSPHKKKLLQNPSGVLQITPESLEALLLRNPQMLMQLFHDLSFVVIDEVHAFMGSERGSQILCLLSRIEQAALCKPRRIGLSATLGDYRGAMRWLAKGSGRGERDGAKAHNALIREEKTKRRVSIAVDHFTDAAGGESDYYHALYRETRGRRCIIFTNSRIEAEEVIASLGKIAKGCGGHDRFYIHHGSIAAGHRDETERELRESHLPITAAATATLEMGIDIGALDRVMQIGPPASVSAFVQRLGRSGRLKKKPQIYFTSLEEKRDWEHPVNALPWGLIKTIAIIELYVKEKWIEPGLGNPLPYSLLLHQTLSVLCSQGGFRPTALARSILALPAFSHVRDSDYAELLSHLAASSFIEKTDDGLLIAGTEAEKLCSHYSFYSVFLGAAEYRVLSGGREIGRINFIPPAGSSIVLGGRYWRVENSAFRRAVHEREIMVSPGEAGSRHVWRGSGVDLHRKVAAYMRKIVTDGEDYPYLSAPARKRLAEARGLAKQWNLAREVFIPAVPSPEFPPDEKAGGPGLFALLPWMGSRGLRTLLLLLQNKDYRKNLGIRSISKENDYSINICSPLPIPRFRAELSSLIKGHKNAESLYPLIDAEQIPLLGKFDQYLPPALLVKQYAAAMLDMGEMPVY